MKRRKVGDDWYPCADGADRRFQFWGGKSTGWVDYPPRVQEGLIEMRILGEGAYSYTAENKSRYQVIVHRDGCHQRRLGGPNHNGRRVRILVRKPGMEYIEEWW